MRLSELLYSQGFGTRRLCDGLIQNGLVEWGGTRVTDPATEVDVGAAGEWRWLDAPQLAALKG